MTVPEVAHAESTAHTVASRHAATAWLRALRVIHPFPTLLNVAATVGLAVLAVRGAPAPSTLLRMVTVMLCAQAAIGVANDYYDRELDAGTKPWKPIAAGLVSTRVAAVLALALIAAAAVTALTLGVASFALAMLGVACGLAYDARLKRTVFSGVPFMVAIPTLPLWVWLTLDVWQPVCWWLLPLGALIGLALHLANTLPDIEADSAYGVTGLAHRIGTQWSARLAWGAFAAALALSAILAAFIRYDLRWYAATLAFGAIALAVSIIAARLRRDEFGLRFGFGVLSLASAALAAGWLAAAT